jgi:hypothetical protein
MDSLQPMNGERHEYRMRWQKRCLFLIIGGGLVANFILYPSKAIPHLIPSVGSYYWDQFIGLTLFSIGLSLLAKGLPSRFVIDGSRIEVRNFIRLHSADMSEIEGFFKDESGYVSGTSLRLKDGRGKIRIPRYFDTDDYFQEWLQQLTNLDIQNKDRKLSLISEEQSLGETPADRYYALEKAKTIRAAFLTITITAAAGLYWGIFPIQALSAVILAVSPLFVLFQLNESPLLYGFNIPNKDPRADLFWPLWPVSIWILTPFYRIEFIAMGSLLLFAVPVAIIYTIALYKYVRKEKEIRRTLWNVTWTFLFLASPFALGLIIVTDTLADRTKPATYIVRILQKEAAESNSTRIHLTVAPWGPFNKPNRLRLNSDQYNSIAQSDRICLDLHPGFLHFSWYEIVPCPIQSASNAAQ